jgi:hypothetical protein
MKICDTLLPNGIITWKIESLLLTKEILATISWICFLQLVLFDNSHFVSRF